MWKALEFVRRLGVLGAVVIAMQFLTTSVFADGGGPGGACQLCGCTALDHFFLCWPPFPVLTDFCYTHILTFCNYGLPILG
jgi:hypothetical protein